MSSLHSVDTPSREPHQSGPSGLWQSLRHFWCRHTETITTPKRDGMPAHIVCRSCGWREPVIAPRPQGTRTWDSSRDEARYRQEKKRRTAVEEQRQLAVAKLATPAPPRGGRVGVARGNLLRMRRAVGD